VAASRKGYIVEIADLTASDALRRIAAGSLAPHDLLEACLDRIAAREAVLRAFAFHDPKLARAATPLAGPIFGIPVGIKDVIDTADQPSQYGSPIWQGWRPRADAWAVSATKAGGGIVMGKTITTEFASRCPGPTTHPLNPRHTPGGSSQGSAAGVAAGCFPLALGTQTAGSIIRPSAFCGVVGFKPSYGLIHRAGMKVMSESLDTIGIIARSVEDCALYGGVLTGLDFAPGVVTDRTPRILLTWEPGAERLDPSSRARIEEVAALCRRAGAAVEEGKLPETVMAVKAAHPIVMGDESWQALGWERAAAPQKLSRQMHEMIAAAESRPAQALIEARLAFAAGRAAFADLMADYDAVLTPSALGEAPEGLAWTGDSLCNAMWTALHGPCVTVPAGTGPKGLPLGVQIVGPHGSDRQTLGWAAWVERLLAG
jgi:Asp-tRNA(Asn)/Glu-tRNA(Gln) amidotransferase A subunit family amidase